MKSQDLSRMGSAIVSLKGYEGLQCIKKQNASPVEIGFYQFAAKQLVGVNNATQSEVRQIKSPHWNGGVGKLTASLC